MTGRRGGTHPFIQTRCWYRKLKLVTANNKNQSPPKKKIPHDHAVFIYTFILFLGSLHFPEKIKKNVGFCFFFAQD